MKRRGFLIGIGALGAAAAGTWFGLRPEDEGAPYEPYFARLNEHLRAQGPGRPLLLIDADILDRNLARLRQILNPACRYRAVVKSLPSEPLLEYILKATGGTRLMAFHLPFLLHGAQRFADSDILLGKPLPVNAARAFYAKHRGRFDPARQLQWLIDTDERLARYQQLAQTLGTRLRVNLEIDVGLHRGGVPAPAQLAPLLQRIAGDQRHLEFAGFMGYDAHVGKLPPLFESREQSHRKSVAAYESFVAAGRGQFPALFEKPGLTFNGAGSMTLALHRERTACNDLAAGSCLLKPSDFDLPTLDGFEPAAFIATPVLKRFDGVRLPGAEWASRPITVWDRNRQQSFFIYGGLWKARYHAPAGLRDNTLYGGSSNQHLVNASTRVALDVDDHVFLRPTQSEAVLLEFGSLWTHRGGRFVERWPVLNQDS